MKIKLLLLIGLYSIMSFGQAYYDSSVYGSSEDDDLQTMGAKDSQGNLYTIGRFQSSSLTFNSITISSHGSTDGFLTKFDSNGSPIWVKGFGGDLTDSVRDIAIDENDNIYLVGIFKSDSFDANPATVNDDGDPNTSDVDEYWLSTTSSLFSMDGFIIKLDSNGDFIWAKQISNPSGESKVYSFLVELDESGNIYVAGQYQLSADFDPGSSDFILTSSNNSDSFLLKLDSNGDFIWVKGIESTYSSAVRGLEVSPDNFVYVTGYYEGAIDLDPSEGETSFSSNGSRDIYMAKYDLDGNYIFGNSFGSSYTEEVVAIRVLPSGIYICGSFGGYTDFDPGPNTSYLSPNSVWDGFLSKFDTMGNFEFVYTLGPGTNESGAGIYNVIEKNNLLLVTGGFTETTDFDNSTITQETTSQGGSDAFVLEMTTGGSYIDHLTLGGEGNESIDYLTITNDNEILLFGNFESSSIDLNPFTGTAIYENPSASIDMFVTRFSTSSLLGLEDYTNDSVRLYPNPVISTINLENGYSFNSYEIYNQIGQIVGEGALTDQEIDFSHFNEGSYYLKLIGDEISTTKKIIKQ